MWGCAAGEGTQPALLLWLCAAVVFCSSCSGTGRQLVGLVLTPSIPCREEIIWCAAVPQSTEGFLWCSLCGLLPRPVIVPAATAGSAPPGCVARPPRDTCGTLWALSAGCRPAASSRDPSRHVGCLDVHAVIPAREARPQGGMGDLSVWWCTAACTWLPPA